MAVLWRGCAPAWLHPLSRTKESQCRAAVLRGGDKPSEDDPAKGKHEARRTDAPAAKDQANLVQKPDKSAARQNVADARKLMIEDGVPEQDTPSHDGPGFGDLEM